MNKKFVLRMLVLIVFGYNLKMVNLSALSLSSVSYNCHVQDIGWQKSVSDGSMAGTSGQSKRLEAIHINLINQEYSGNIVYKTHVQDIGWQNFVYDGSMAGTSGQSKRLEAISIELTDEMAEHYDIIYRVHVQNFGWLDWAKNGELSGSATYGYRLEGIEIKLVTKDSFKTNQNKSYISRNVQYRTHVQDIGWQDFVYDGSMAGTSGQSKRLEGITIQLPDLENLGATGGIEYCTHVQDIGWQSKVSNGIGSGTSGQSKRLEAIQINLTGDLKDKYDIVYRVHVQNLGWLSWAKNGQSAGSEGYGYRLEGIEIKLVAKDSITTNENNSFTKKTAPTISDVNVNNVTSSGYKVSCKVTSNAPLSEVKFATWTNKNGQDDLRWTNGTVIKNSDGTYNVSYNVFTSLHNNENGLYNTHIYAYSSNGLVSSVYVTTINVPEPEKAILITGDSRVYVGNILQLSSNVSVNWTSSNNNIATIDENGVITAKESGTVTISAISKTNSSNKATKIITVNANIVTIEIMEGNVTSDGGTMLLMANVANKMNIVNWSSSNEDIAIINSNGLVTGKGIVGTVTFTAVCSDGTVGTFTYNIVTPVLKFTTKTTSVKVMKELDLSLFIQNDFKGDVVFKVDDESIATITGNKLIGKQATGEYQDNNRLVSFDGNGIHYKDCTVTITAYVGDKQSSNTLKVDITPVSASDIPTTGTVAQLIDIVGTVNWVSIGGGNPYEEWQRFEKIMNVLYGKGVWQQFPYEKYDGYKLDRPIFNMIMDDNSYYFVRVTTDATKLRTSQFTGEKLELYGKIYSSLYSNMYHIDTYYNQWIANGWD